MPMIAKIVQTAKQMVKAKVDIHRATAGACAGTGCLISDMASPWPDKVVPLHLEGEKRKAAGQGHAKRTVRFAGS
jgi:hypothetical protein